MLEDPSPLTEVDPEPHLNAGKNRLFNNLIISFSASLGAAFQISYTKYYPYCVDSTFAKTSFCLMRLYSGKV